MTPKRQFSEDALMARLQDRAGTRYQSSQLANYFGIPTARMTAVLKKMHALGQIRCVRCGGNPTMYYIATMEQVEMEQRVALRNQAALAPVTYVLVEAEGP